MAKQDRQPSAASAGSAREVPLLDWREISGGFWSAADDRANSEADAER